MRTYKLDNNINAIDYICITFICVSTISSIFSPLRVLGNNDMYCIASLLAWCLISFMQKPSFFLRLPIRRVIAFTFIIHSVAFPYILGNGTIGNRYLSLIMFPLGYIIYEYYKESKKIKLIGYVIKITLPFAVLTMIRTAQGLITNPYLARSIKSSGEYTVSILSRGIGGYETIYFLVFLSIITLFCFLRASKKLERLLLLIGYMLMGFTVILSNYFTALIIIVVASLIAIITDITSKKNGVIYSVLLFFICVILVFWGQALISNLIDLLLKSFPEGKTAVRLTEMKYSMLAGVSNEFLSDRGPLLIDSLNTVIRHPFFGLVTTKISSGSGALTGFGQHSHILDTFALLGIVMGFLNIYLILLPFTKERFCGNKKICTIPILLATVAVLLFNNATVSIAFAINLIYPYIIDNTWNLEGLATKK